MRGIDRWLRTCLAFALLGACGSAPEVPRPGSPPGTDGRAQPATGSDGCAPAGWIASEMVSEELDARDRPPGAQVEAHLLAWRIKEDDRPLRVEEAIVRVEVKTGSAPPRWLLLHVFRHPDEPSGHARAWSLAQIADTAVTGVVHLEAAPTAADIDGFMHGGAWNDGLSGFREVGGGACRAAWPAGAGPAP